MMDQSRLLTSSNQLLDVDPAKQFEWHEAHRDVAKNQYRTSYSDMIHGREVACKSDYPSGYAGHIPNLRHDILFRNTNFDRVQALKRADPSRDAHPSFQDQIQGIPTWCAKPQGAKKHPTFGTIPHKATTGTVRPPWGVVKPVVEPPTYRVMPSTMMRTRSMPQLRRTQEASGALSASGRAALTNPQNMAAAMDQMATEQPAPQPTSPTSDRLKKSVNLANAEAMRQRMPTEAEMLMQEMGVDGY